MRFVTLLGLLVLWAAPAAAEQFGSFTLHVVNHSSAPLVFTVNQGSETTVAPGATGRFGKGFGLRSVGRQPGLSVPGDGERPGGRALVLGAGAGGGERLGRRLPVFLLAAPRAGGPVPFDLRLRRRGAKFKGPPSLSALKLKPTPLLCYAERSILR